MYVELSEEKLVYKSMVNRLKQTVDVSSFEADTANNDTINFTLGSGMNGAQTMFPGTWSATTNNYYGRTTSQFNEAINSISIYERGEQIVKRLGIDIDKIISNIVVIDFFNMIRNVGPERINAYRNAIRLCKKYLSSDEWQELITKNQVTVKSQKHPELSYVVPESGRVKIFKGEQLVVESCAIVDDVNYTERFPIGDVILSKVMAIKSDEEYFVQSANNQYHAHIEEFREYFEMKKETVVEEWEVQDAQVIQEEQEQPNRGRRRNGSQNTRRTRT